LRFSVPIIEEINTYLKSKWDDLQDDHLNN
jgi:hypothetical protein